MTRDIRSRLLKLEQAARSKAAAATEPNSIQRIDDRLRQFEQLWVAARDDDERDAILADHAGGLRMADIHAAEQLAAEAGVANVAEAAAAELLPRYLPTFRRRFGTQGDDHVSQP